LGNNVAVLSLSNSETGQVGTASYESYSSPEAQVFSIMNPNMNLNAADEKRNTAVHLFKTIHSDYYG
jgi:hypothetical protein